MNLSYLYINNKVDFVHTWPQKMKTWAANKLTWTKPSEGQNLISDMVPCHLLIPTISPHCHPQVTTEKHTRILWGGCVLVNNNTRQRKSANASKSAAARSQHRYNVGVYPSCLLPGITFLLLRLFIRRRSREMFVACSSFFFFWWCALICVFLF